jgi:hypothetical protein
MPHVPSQTPLNTSNTLFDAEERLFSLSQSPAPHSRGLTAVVISCPAIRSLPSHPADDLGLHALRFWVAIRKLGAWMTLILGIPSMSFNITGCRSVIFDTKCINTPGGYCSSCHVGI